MPERRSQEELQLNSFQKARGILRIFCWPPCPTCIISKLAFHPPEPSYKTVPISSETSGSPGESGWRMILLRDGCAEREADVTLTFVHIRRCLCSKRRIAVMLLSLPQPSEFIILHSHVNGADLGGLYDYLVYVREKLSCEIVSYDYCGYGASSGSATESNVLKAGVAVVQYITGVLKKPLHKVILYGQSIGSVPTAYLASKYEVAGVVFHSGLYSGLRVLLPNKRKKSLCSCVDPFRNVDLMSEIRSPVLFIHGTEDLVIPFSHARDMYRMCKTAVKPLWINGGGHTGLELERAFIRRLRKFLKFLKERGDQLENDEAEKGRPKSPAILATPPKVS